MLDAVGSVLDEGQEGVWLAAASRLSDLLWRPKESSASLKMFISKNGKRPYFLGLHSEVYIFVLPVEVVQEVCLSAPCGQITYLPTGTTL